MLNPVQLEEFRTFLKNLARENKLDGLLLADIEGLPLVSYLVEEDMDEDSLAAAGAAIFTASLMTASDAKKKGVDQVIVHSPDGYIIYTQVIEDIVLGLIAPKDAKLGILKMIIKEIEAKLEEYKNS